MVAFAGADKVATVLLVLEIMVVPSGNMSIQPITLPTSAATKLAVGDVSVKLLIVVEPSVKVSAPISHGGDAVPATTLTPINFPLVAARAKQSSIGVQL